MKIISQIHQAVTCSQKDIISSLQHTDWANMSIKTTEIRDTRTLLIPEKFIVKRLFFKKLEMSPHIKDLEGSLH
uniref:Uncharacterized protein n=1 Tax=Arundo donax TaxID=35708 RepID=A0A0A9EAT8_ARUDO